MKQNENATFISMKGCVAGILISLVMVASNPFILHVSLFTINQTSISTLFCINKAKPELHCDGKCYLMQKLKSVDKPDSRENLPSPEGKGPLWFEYVAHDHADLMPPLPNIPIDPYSYTILTMDLCDISHPPEFMTV